jgi:hypothetical protein
MGRLLRFAQSGWLDLAARFNHNNACTNHLIMKFAFFTSGCPRLDQIEGLVIGLEYHLFFMFP